MGISKTIEIHSKTGLHARPASNFVQLTKKFSSSVHITAKDKRIDGKSIMGVLSLALKKGDTFDLEVDGIDAEEALHEIDDFFNNLVE